MNAVISKKETIISYTIAILFILAMVIAGVLLNDPEVILPEIAAMAIALWAYREPGWLRQPEKIFIAPSITAVIDSWIVVTLFNMILMLILLKIVGVRIPAAYAFPLLPLVFPDEMIKMLPVGSFIAGVFLFGAVLLYKKWEMKQKGMQKSEI